MSIDQPWTASRKLLPATRPAWRSTPRNLRWSSQETGSPWVFTVDPRKVTPRQWCLSKWVGSVHFSTHYCHITLYFFVCVCCELQGAPESILDRCTSVRINGCDKVAMTPGIRDQIIELVQRYGTGMELCQTSLAYVAFNGCEER